MRTLRIVLLLIILQTTQSTAQIRAKVAPYQGRPTIFINDQPHSPQIYALTHAFGGRWSWEEKPARNLRNFCEVGIRLFQVDLYLEDIWPKNAEKLDLEKALRQVRGVLDACPDAAIFVRLHTNAPYWWNELHREECTEYADGPIDHETYGPPRNLEDGDPDRPLRASLASLRWRQEAGERVREFCQRMAATPEGQRMAGIHVAGGVYGEWHYWGFIEHEPDTGPAMTRYFREWLRKKYGTDAALQQAWQSTQFTLANATVPDTTERNRCLDGIFREPAREQRVIDYFIAQQEVVAEDIEYFCRIVKQAWPRPLIVGVFYGYFHMTFCRQAAGGHIFIERIMDCPDVDYLSGPQTYWEITRKAGGSGSSRGIVESALLHGKLWLDEIDNGYLQTWRDMDFVHSRPIGDTVYAAVLSRSVALPLLRGAGFWYYDFGRHLNSGWWDSPLYLARIRQLKSLFDSQLHLPHRPVADVLYVYDQEHFYYLKNQRQPLCEDVPDLMVEEALRSGTAGDHVYLFDLPKVDLARYKAIVFVNAYKMSADDRKFIKEKVAQNGRTLIWNYLPGYTDGHENSLHFVAELTGMRLHKTDSPTLPTVRFGNPDTTWAFESPVQPLAAIEEPEAEMLGWLDGAERHEVIVRKQFSTHTSVLAALPLHGSDVWREVFRVAGCHVYNEHNDFTYANGSLLLLHTASGGERTVRLRNGSTIKMDLSGAATWLLNAETGEVVLRH
ncbi:MAG: hypothetical protein KF734_14620 [Saprospiraceae bacterium]|nr:hypothetical protein [Saprospiraceae bacterium]